MAPQQHPHGSHRTSRLFVVIDGVDGSVTNSNSSHGMSVTHRDTNQASASAEAGSLRLAGDRHSDYDTGRQGGGYLAHSLIDAPTPSKPCAAGAFSKPLPTLPLFGKHVLPLKADHLRSLAFKPVMVKSSSWGGAGSDDSAQPPRQPHRTLHHGSRHHWSIDLLLAALVLCVLLPAAFHIMIHSRRSVLPVTASWTAFGVPAPSFSGVSSGSEAGCSHCSHHDAAGGDGRSRRTGPVEAGTPEPLDADASAAAVASTGEESAAEGHLESADVIDDVSTRGNRLTRRNAGSGDGSGLCIAIPSMPRPNPSKPGRSLSFHASQLLRALDSHRAKAPLLERDTRVVVHSSGCNLPPLPFNASNVESLREAARQLAAEAYESEQDAMHLLMALADMRAKNRLAEEHTRNLQAVASEVDLRVTVMDHSREQPGCEFVKDHTAMLRQGREAMNAYAGEDAWKLWLWRSKLALDFTHVTRACLETHPQYVLMLQDDTLPVELYDIGIERFMYRDLRFKPDWSLLSLYHPETFHWHYSHTDEYPFPCCAQAVLFNVSQLAGLLEQVQEGYWRQPMDFQIRDFLKQPGRRAYVHVPSLFQHAGDVRSGGSVKGVRHLDTQFYEKIVTRPYLTEPGSGRLTKRDGMGKRVRHSEPLYAVEENKLHPRHTQAGEEGKASEGEEVRVEERERFQQLMAGRGQELDRKIAGLTKNTLRPGLSISSIASKP